jgi:hypothetical protein
LPRTFAPGPSGYRATSRSKRHLHACNQRHSARHSERQKQSERHSERQSIRKSERQSERLSASIAVLVVPMAVVWQSACNQRSSE